MIWKTNIYKTIFRYLQVISRVHIHLGPRATGLGVSCSLTNGLVAVYLKLAEVFCSLSEFGLNHNEMNWQSLTLSLHGRLKVKIWHFLVPGPFFKSVKKITFQCIDLQQLQKQCWWQINISMHRPTTATETMLVKK